MIFLARPIFIAFLVIKRWETLDNLPNKLYITDENVYLLGKNTNTVAVGGGGAKVCVTVTGNRNLYIS